MSEHPVRRALTRDVLPYLISARRLRRQWFYRLYVVFGYTTDFVVALAAVDISSPLLKLLVSVGDSGQKPTPSPALRDALSSVPAWLIYPTAVAVVVWIILRVAFNREEGQKRSVLVKSCCQALRQAEASLPGILSKPDPMPEITELLEKKIRPAIDRNIQENAWPWTPYAPAIDNEIVQEVNDLCSHYERDWAPVESASLRRRT